MIFGAARIKALAAQHGSATGRLEGHRIRFSALITSNLKSLALAASTTRSAKIRSARIPTRFATFGMSQVAFPVIFLFALGEGEGRRAFRACNFKIWHGTLSPIESKTEGSALSALRGSLWPGAWPESLLGRSHPKRFKVRRVYSRGTGGSMSQALKRSATETES